MSRLDTEPKKDLILSLYKLYKYKYLKVGNFFDTIYREKT